MLLDEPLFDELSLLLDEPLFDELSLLLDEPVLFDDPVLFDEPVLSALFCPLVLVLFADVLPLDFAFDELDLVVLVESPSASSGFVATGLSGVVETAAALAPDDVVRGGVVRGGAVVTVALEVFVATGFEVGAIEVGRSVVVAGDEPAALTTVSGAEPAGAVVLVEPDVLVEPARTVLVAGDEPAAVPSPAGLGAAVVDEALVTVPAGSAVCGGEVGAPTTPGRPDALDEGAGAGEDVVGPDDELTVPAGEPAEAVPPDVVPPDVVPAEAVPRSGWLAPDGVAPCVTVPCWLAVDPTVTAWGVTDRPAATAAASLSATARAADCGSGGSAGSPGCGRTGGSDAAGAGKTCSCARWAGGIAMSGTHIGAASGSSPVVSGPAPAAGRVAPR